MIKTIKLTIWEREFELPIEYDCYKGEEITKEQFASAEGFASHQEWIDSSKKDVEEFCKEKVSEDEENLKKDNVFSYIKPEYLFIKRDENHPRVAIMCKYRYDPEHGVAIVFSDKGVISVGPQDIIL